MTPLRSTTGCWTCRARKKKCDEAKPTCNICAERHLKCHGYDSKPQFMQSPEGQRAEIEKLKKAVSESVRARRALRVSKRTNSAGQNSSYRDKDGRNLFAGDVESDLFKQLSLDSVNSLDQTTSGLSGVKPYIKVHEMMAVSTERPTKLPQTVSSTLSFLPGISPADDESEYKMIMNYMTRIFPLQFYFYRPSTAEHDLNWLLNLLLRARCTYFTSLAFSALHQIIHVYDSDDPVQSLLSADLDYYHTKAVQELQFELDYLPAASGSEHLRVGVDVLACTLQLLSIEVFRETKHYAGCKGDWEIHLHAAGNLLSVIASNLEVKLDGSWSSAKSTASLPLDTIPGLDFFATTYAWCDIFHRSSLGPDFAPPVPFPYTEYLLDDRLRLDRLMGCRNWAMTSILEISNLSSWKNQQRKARTLSIPELCTRAAQIANRIEANLESLPKDLNQLTPYEREVEQVTESYALAALIYLSVVVSGNSHLLPEVQARVKRSLSALQRLPQHLLMRVSWAFCVAGCMAGDDGEKGTFREILSSAEANGHGLGTLWNSLDLMEAFWELRWDLGESEMSDRFPWAIAMRHLNLKILII